jgi:hypothetical protein
VKDKLEGNKNQAKEEERDGKKWADEFVVQPRLFFIEYIVYIVGDIWKRLHVYLLNLKKFLFLIILSEKQERFRTAVKLGSVFCRLN